MQRLVRVRHQHALLNQPGGQYFRAVAMAAQFEGPVVRLAPCVAGLGVTLAAPRLRLKIVIQPKNAKRRNDVFAKIFVLIVAENHDEIRLERIDHAALRAKVFDQARAVFA